MWQKNKTNNWRFYFLVFLLVLGFLSLIYRFIYLGTVKKNFLEKESAARSVRIIEIPAHRGIIYDRNGNPLAISSPVESVWLSPQSYEATPSDEAKLARLIGIDSYSLRKKITVAKNRDFIYLKRRLPPEIVAKIKALHIPGLFSQQEYQRFYPEGEVTLQVLGVTNIDDYGSEGLELAYDKWLRGTVGKKEVTKDRLGHIVNELRLIQAPQDGRDLVLSIDRNMQYLAYRELKNTVEKYHAEAGSAIILDVKTGEILAMASVPSYNPNGAEHRSLNALRNRGVIDLLEPGSTMKTFSILSALESGKYFPATKINTSPGWWMIGKNKVEDEHDEGVLNLVGILQKSSDVGVAKITLSLPFARLPALLSRVGFGQSTQSGFPGEAIGIVPHNLEHRSFVLATLAFGYAISVTPLQIARAYAMLADDGVLRPCTFLKSNTPLKGMSIIAPKFARQILAMLESVLSEGGTGKRAQVTSYHIAGKTGTSKIAMRGGYEKDKFNALFVGVAPLSEPRLVVIVTIKDPRGQHLGGVVAAPVFSKIMEGALQMLNIVPDNVVNASPSKGDSGR